MNNKIKTVVIGTLVMLPSLLLSQNEGDRTIGGGINIEHLNFQRSPLGVRRDVDIGFSFNYFKILSPTIKLDTLTAFNQAKLGRTFSHSFGAGFSIGIDGYYNNTDSIVMHETTAFLGPVFRYYMTRRLFFEGSMYFEYSHSSIEIPDHVSGNQIYFASGRRVGFSFELGIGYRIKINNSLSLEPIIAYQRYLARTPNDQNESVYKFDKAHEFNFYIYLQYYF